MKRAILLALVVGCPALVLAQTRTNQAKSPAETEAAYRQAIEKRAADILAALDLKDTARASKVHEILISQYRSLRDWHDTNDAKLKGAAADQAGQINASLKALHDKFISALAAELTPEQVEKVKDRMTYNKVQVTYDAYLEIVPNLTEPQKKKILELLKEAREEAMDAGSADEKSAIFKKYKGKINNFLTAEGQDVKQAYKDWGERQKGKKSVEQ